MYLKFILDIVLLISALAFIIGLRQQSSPDTARRGNLISGLGMGLAIMAVLFGPLEGASNNYGWIAGGLVGGGIIGYYAAVKVKMTAMPQFVSLFNGFGGACAVLLGSIELYRASADITNPGIGELLIICFTLLFGSVAFTGSLLAYGKLDGLVDDSKITFGRHQLVNTGLLILTFSIAIYISVVEADVSLTFVWIFLIISLIYGVSFVAPIGGADMPVVISLLNSFTGLTAAAAGLIYGSQIMLLGGVLVGAAGTILTVMMCNAMNRSLLNVIIGGFGSTAKASSAGGGSQVPIKEISLPDAAILLYYSKSVVIVPGYGLAVAQAQKDCRELDEQLEENGVSVKYAIHPVAGRMPGHMNVLLAEADVPYPKLLDLDESNPIFPQTDVVVIVGANDVVNPAAQTDPGSPIYGMPVLEVWNAKHVIVMKRSMSKGYAGVENPLFFHERTKMLFGDAKDTMQKLVREVKQL
jgi:NAD(P) transhydrogenase subunit beta